MYIQQSVNTVCYLYFINTDNLSLKYSGYESRDVYKRQDDSIVSTPKSIGFSSTQRDIHFFSDDKSNEDYYIPRILRVEQLKKLPRERSNKYFPDLSSSIDAVSYTHLFCDKTDFNTTEELIPEEANLLNIANFTSEVYADNLDNYYPRQNVVENIMADDKGKLKVDKKTQQLIDLAIETGNDRIVLELQQHVTSHPNKNRSFHYLPYRTDQP